MPQLAQTIDPSKPLSDQQRELYCRRLILNGGNHTRTYKEVFGVSQDNAVANAWRMKVRDGVMARVRWLMDADDELNPEAQVLGLKEALVSTKPFMSKDELLYVPDNANRLEARKTILRIQGVLNTNANVNINNTANTVHVNVSCPEREDRLTGMMAILEKTVAKLEGRRGMQSGEVIDAVISK